MECVVAEARVTVAEAAAIMSTAEVEALECVLAAVGACVGVAVVVADVSESVDDVADEVGAGEGDTCITVRAQRTFAALLRPVGVHFLVLFPLLLSVLPTSSSW